MGSSAERAPSILDNTGAGRRENQTRKARSSIQIMPMQEINNRSKEERFIQDGFIAAGAMAVLLETTLGDVVIDLYTEERPRACLNFLKLCKIKYYNYCLIHNVQRDFIIQTGDPTGTGRGGESIFGQLYGDQASFFEAEKVPRIKHKKKGTVSMVNNGSGQHGSQFLITTGENLDYLDGVHTVFGEVTEGMDIVKKINETFVDKDFVPYQDIRYDPFDDPPDLLIPDRSPEPTKEQLDSGRIGADEEIDDFKGRSAEEVEEIKAEKEAKTQAILLEMVGDLPDADIKPPENVLFVCKLNPVTTDEDLEIIFSRFGPIRSCEVIRDWKTGESLCYAFIEFEKYCRSLSESIHTWVSMITDRRKTVRKRSSGWIMSLSMTGGCMWTLASLSQRLHGREKAAMVFHLSERFLENSEKLTEASGCFLCSSRQCGKYTKSDFKEYEKEQDKPANLVLKEKVKPKQEYPL
ncbi:Peptidyl-prolyl cis-trans isomerase-like 4 [Apodemus speciosus]|uniref:Peptidyl-prolyl cis-trans isomerase n=1 Tax=Apodemus speciosus TaxID=105296 RepID=A0ABQ0F6P0_APOSI